MLVNLAIAEKFSFHFFLLYTYTYIVRLLYSWILIFKRDRSQNKIFLFPKISFLAREFFARVLRVASTSGIETYLQSLKPR